MINFNYQAILEKVDLTNNCRFVDVDILNRLLINIKYIPVKYSKSFVDFRIEYLKSNGHDIRDLSLILYNDGHPCGYLPLCLDLFESTYSLNSFSEHIVEPLFIEGLSNKTQEKICAKIYVLLVELKCLFGLNLSICSSFNNHKLSKLQRLFLSNNAAIGLFFEMYVDLQLSLEEIKSQFRKSYKSLISKSLKLWNVQVFNYENITETEWDKFKNLHYQVSRKKTRSDESWLMQLQDIKNANSFYIALTDQENELIGGSYFLITKDEAYYGVAAYKRELFDKPIGHIVQYIAIEYCKKINLKWYKIGERNFKHLKEQITDKEINIEDFKEGFSSCIIPIPTYTINEK